MTCIYDCTTKQVFFAYKFTGKERDAESGLDDFEARYCSSTLGRFMSPDEFTVTCSPKTGPKSDMILGHLRRRGNAKKEVQA